MNIRKKRSYHDEDAMAAMNDIMFFLMLFFLIISTLSNPNVIKILLPKADNSSTIARQPLTLTVSGEPDAKKYYLGSTEVDGETLEAALDEATQRNEDKTVVLRIAKNLTVQDLVSVMAIGAKLDLKMVLSTTK